VDEGEAAGARGDGAPDEGAVAAVDEVAAVEGPVEREGLTGGAERVPGAAIGPLLVLGEGGGETPDGVGVECGAAGFDGEDPADYRLAQDAGQCGTPDAKQGGELVEQLPGAGKREGDFAVAAAQPGEALREVGRPETTVAGRRGTSLLGEREDQLPAEQWSARPDAADELRDLGGLARLPPARDHGPFVRLSFAFRSPFVRMMLDERNGFVSVGAGTGKGTVD